MTGGILINGNEISGNAKLAPGEKFDLDGTEYSLTDDAASMALTYDTFAPYAGIGWDTTFGDDDRWGFTFDIGVVFSGSPDFAIIAKVDSADPNSGNFEEAKKKKLMNQKRSSMTMNSGGGQCRYCLSILIVSYDSGLVIPEQIKRILDRSQKISKNAAV